MNAKYSQRMSTEPSKCEEDIEEQSTYEIMDENIDYGNFKRRPVSKSKPINDNEKLNSGNRTIEKQQLNKKYKQEIKEKLLNGKSKREGLVGLSKEDIEKKYFIR